MSVINFFLSFKFSETPNLSGLVTALLHNIYLIFVIFFSWVVFILILPSPYIRVISLVAIVLLFIQNRFIKFQKISFVSILLCDTLFINLNALFSSFQTFLPLFFL